MSDPEKIWRPVGHTLCQDDDMIVDQFRREHPEARGDMLIHPTDDSGFRRIEFWGRMTPGDPRPLYKSRDID